MTDTQIERLAEFRGNDLADLCDAAEAAIGELIPFLNQPHRDTGHRARQRHPGIHHGERCPAYCGHRRRAV